MNRINEQDTSSFELKFGVLVVQGTMFLRDQGIWFRRVSNKYQVKNYQDSVRAKPSKARVAFCRPKATVHRVNLSAVHVFDATSGFRKQQRRRPRI